MMAYVELFPMHAASLVMNQDAASLERALALSKRRIAKQKAKVTRQRKLVELCEADGQSSLVMQESRELLRKMIETLDEVLAEHRAIQQRLLDTASPLDEKSIDAVTKDCPL